MINNYVKLSKALKTSLEQQYKISKKQLILNPVENIPDINYLEFGSSFLYGIYNSDKLRTDKESINTKIQFANRESVAMDINKIYAAWCELLKAEVISMRFFSGLHAHTTIFMAITNIGDNVVVLPEKAGGHMATKTILERLGLNVYELKIDFENMRIDVDSSRQLIESVKPIIVFIDRSEGMIYEDFTWLANYKEIYKIFDASQYLTNILAGDYKSPFDMGFDAILSTTHKNFPGPQRALYCSKKKDKMWEKIYSKIGTYVSNMHPYAIYSLGLMLENYEKYQDLSYNMLNNAEKLKKYLSECNVNVIYQQPINDLEKNTHHIWIGCEDKVSAFKLYKRWEQYGFLTNYRLLPYNLGYGIRLGLSAATVSGLTSQHIFTLSNLLSETYHNEEYDEVLNKKIELFITNLKEQKDVK